MNYNGFTHPVSKWICGMDENGNSNPIDTASFASRPWGPRVDQSHHPVVALNNTSSTRSSVTVPAWLAGDAVGLAVTDLITGNQYAAYDDGCVAYVNVSLQGRYGVILEQ